jgi:hypothetical protein
VTLNAGPNYEAAEGPIDGLSAGQVRQLEALRRALD